MNLLQLGPKLLLKYDLLYFTAQGCVSMILNTSFRLKKTLKRKQVKSNHVKAEIQGSFLKCPAEINLAILLISDSDTLLIEKKK